MPQLTDVELIIIELGDKIVRCENYILCLQRRYVPPKATIAKHKALIKTYRKQRRVYEFGLDVLQNN